MYTGTRSRFFIVLVVLSLLLTSCSKESSMVASSANKAKLAACPTSPNCVSSDAADNAHLIEPFRFAGAAAAAWRMTQSLVAKLPRTKIVTVDGNYLHAECRSAVFGFVDDLELQLRPQEKLIAVRSAARLGYSDFGVNRKRVEQLRSELLKAGVIE